ncbi:MAG: 2-amino-4-hydroxy-6-hydroxymethyldihydropteridine diphosphokinase [Treponema sp.]|nr:2-amino-4-hydroxy-6-hydroxymethyldihydropteridine diphosphokinase [Treponema sp.]
MTFSEKSGALTGPAGDSGGGGLCVLGLGSNRGLEERGPLELLNSAAGELSRILKGLRSSPVYKTAPLYVTDQGAFLNCAVCGFFRGGPEELLTELQAVETRHGRDRSRERRWGERSLDIDILLFGDAVFNNERLTIPHPRLTERAFALRPLIDLLPHARDPHSDRPYRDILAGLPDQGVRFAGKMSPLPPPA